MQQWVFQLCSAKCLASMRRTWATSLLALAMIVPLASADAANVTPIDTSQFFNWAQSTYPTLFPSGAVSQTIGTPAASYTVRHYPSTGIYLGVGDQDGVVYAAGAFSGNQVIALGKMADYTCDVTGNCVLMAPDANGNLLAAGITAATDVSLRAGAILQFQALSPQDSIIEVNSAALTSTQLCNDANLPAGAAHPVVAQSPIPAGHYAGNELSGPYRTYPAGIFPMANGSGSCGYIEKKVPCVAPNESQLLSGAIANSAGGTDYLCVVTPFLMSAADPTRPASNPPLANPACVRGKTLESTWADPATQGVFIRLSWLDINPAYGVYDWSVLDREFVSAVRNAKTVMVGIEVGGNSIPAWAFTTGHPTLGAAKKVTLKDWGTAADSFPNSNCGFDYVVASPSDAAFKALFKKAMADMAAHIRSDQRKFSVLAGIKVTGMGMATLENRLPNRCNIAVKNTALGDTGTQGHIIAMSTTSLSSPVFDTKYSVSADPTLARVKDVSQCICNPQVLQFAGYRPSNLQAFYSEVEATIHENFGYKQQVFMNISNGFPQIGETGRFLGDHLAPPITGMSTSNAGLPVYSYGSVYARAASAPADIPGVFDTTTAVVTDARNGVFAGGDLTVAKSFGVENAALDVIGFSQAPNSGVRCSQQVGIDVIGTFAGSPSFPIAAGTRIDASGASCPNILATREGVDYDKAGGFQIVAGLDGAVDVDASLWNMTLNTNGLFYEHYEKNAWVARKQSALNAGGVLDPNPAVKKETATPNFASASAKSGAQWNALLLARARAFSANPAHTNLYQVDPFPATYAVTIASAPGSTRRFFNSRACKAFVESGTPVRINTLTISN